MKFNKKTVYDYINCNDISEFTIEELENDMEFMIEVIKISHDKNIYELCSDELKNNVNFINYLVDTFKNDSDFILNISKPCLLKKDSNDIETVKLLAKICAILSKEKQEEIAGLQMILFTNFLIDDTATKKIINDNKDDEELTEELGKGFSLLKEFYDEDEYVLNYYAKNYINEIMEKDVGNLENYIHSNYDSYEKIETYGINRFLIELIRKYDVYLSNYISFRTYLLDDLKIDMHSVKKRWDFYELTSVNNKWELLLEKLNNYIETNEKIIPFEIEEFYTTCLNYDLYKDFFSKNIKNPEKIFNYISNNIFDIDKMDFVSKKHYYEIKKMFIKILSINTLKFKDSDVREKQEDKKTKILNFTKKI